MIQYDGVELLRKDPILGEIIDKVGDYSLKKRTQHFAVLVESIISQQLATNAAEAIFRRFRKLYPRFPTTAQILSTRKSKLRKAGLSGMKIDYLKDLARNIEEGRLDMKSLPKMSDDEVIEHLTQVKGIGRWTAEMFLIFSLGRQDVLPVHDLGLRKGVQVAFSLTELPKPKEVEKLGERWRPYRSIATWYLWKSLKKFDKIG
ncbi:MAG: DNA-3-methyladenine glycosylase [Thaumarchaeota archaeon 13_1_40CM_38_12]|nr:MAG: DNA-3-methyladenine glycosylase [Thaumarchaeota archaeon 13_1_40CM_38_12]OLD28806.1 MAG: DNA-3-methyladenine glycosylase [Thaumarchaeota archaeon 13_1_40CM_2_39_7]